MSEVSYSLGSADAGRKLHRHFLQGDVRAGISVPCIVLGILTDNYGIIASVFVVQFNGFMSLIC
jgi:hypothetical protein